eukprot:Gregarina_sp_Poly_1__4893@NODE_25_length_19863_cov_179_262730_g23_i0_p2_GENE_NODE_25_length_19863_cov_179_262730_g23_i0NODE_25_length_19863_cov_179_262730_g23_i0_p2_ORF_typecomplete_len958_score106_79ANAPC4_WD40/PF12894_7/4e03ANAPC4_WD40/PF12894_7/7_7e06ANAPC4_WD40/PF12894_7/0_00024ANAPC4_WD40/PF12894_7/21WD40_like/PF17005_5/0_071WD40_like/PF17005_5/0_021WD40/PF00400_32/1WD40/PF00400_32/0_0025WD40/PF00400_32/7_9e02PALB2_WD40/PF16756_5/2_5PALB2_WD40/PF16756_5/0_46PALB2_WD40/PF16756_5/83Nup160/PF1
MNVNDHLVVATDKSIKCISLTTGIEIATTTEAANNGPESIFVFGTGGRSDRGFIAACDSSKPLLRFYRLDKFNTSCKRVTLPEKAAAAACSLDGTIIAVGCASGNLHIWDSTTGAFLRLINLSQRISRIRFLPQYLLICGRNSVFVYPLSEIVSIDESIHEYVEPMVLFTSHRSEITCIDANSVGIEGWIATGDRDGNIYVWDIQNGDIISYITSNSIPLSLCHNPTSTWNLLIGYDSGELKSAQVRMCALQYGHTERLVPITSFELPTVLQVPSAIEYCCYSESTDFILTASGKAVTIWEAQSRQVHRALECDDKVTWITTGTTLRAAEEIAANIKSRKIGSLEIIPPFRILETIPGSLRNTFVISLVAYNNLKALTGLSVTVQQSDIDKLVDDSFYYIIRQYEWKHTQIDDENEIKNLETDYASISKFLKSLLTEAIKKKEHIAQQEKIRSANSQSEVDPKQFLYWRIAKAVSIMDEEADENRMQLDCPEKRPNSYSEPLPSWSKSRKTLLHGNTSAVVLHRPRSYAYIEKSESRHENKSSVLIAKSPEAVPAIRPLPGKICVSVAVNDRSVGPGHTGYRATPDITSEVESPRTSTVQSIGQETDILTKGPSPANLMGIQSKDSKVDENAPDILSQGVGESDVVEIINEDSDNSQISDEDTSPCMIKLIETESFEENVKGAEDIEIDVREMDRLKEFKQGAKAQEQGTDQSVQIDSMSGEETVEEDAITEITSPEQLSVGAKIPFALPHIPRNLEGPEHASSGIGKSKCVGIEHVTTTESVGNRVNRKRPLIIEKADNPRTSKWRRKLLDNVQSGKEPSEQNLRIQISSPQEERTEIDAEVASSSSTTTNDSTREFFVALTRLNEDVGAPPKLLTSSPAASEPASASLDVQILRQRIKQKISETKQKYDLPLRQLPRCFPLKSLIRKRRAYNVSRVHSHPISTADLIWYLRMRDL